MDEKMAERISSKPRQSRVKKGLSKFGACRKKKWDLRKKTTHGKSTREAFQQWIDHVRKKHREQMNNDGRLTTEMRRYVPWDPGGFIYETRYQKFSSIEARMTHRSPYHLRVATRTLARG
jgi:hypothetical protein